MALNLSWSLFIQRIFLVFFGKKKELYLEMHKCLKEKWKKTHYYDLDRVGVSNPELSSEKTWKWKDSGKWAELFALYVVVPKRCQLILTLERSAQSLCRALRKPLSRYNSGINQWEFKNTWFWKRRREFVKGKVVLTALGVHIRYNGKILVLPATKLYC